MKNYSIRSLEIFSSPELFRRAPDVVESLDYEYHEYCEFGVNIEPTLALVSDYLCDGDTDARSLTSQASGL